jgi:DNA-binding CsgD family transcriptional regulator
MAGLVDERPRLMSALHMPVEAMAAPQVMTNAATRRDITVGALILREPRSDFSQDSDQFTASPATPAQQGCLTYREQDVLALLCLRLTDAEIAEQLFLSPRTINSHVAHILAKLGVKNRREAVARAVRLRLV